MNAQGICGRFFGTASLRSLALLSALLGSQLTMAGPVEERKTLQRQVDPVVVAGMRLPELAGTEIDSIRVFAFHDDKAMPVPFQVDQRDSGGGWVWDVIYRQPVNFNEEGLRVSGRRKPFRQGRGTVDDQDPPGMAVMDNNDDLVFMAEDLGDRVGTLHGIADAALILELEVADTLLGQRGWAYIATFRTTPPPLSDLRYMHYDMEQGTVHSPVYRFHISDDHPALITDLRVNGHPIVDRIKVKGDVNLSLPLPARQIEFSEEDIHGYTKGYIEGPVRIIKRNIAYLSLSGGLVRTRDLTCDHFYYSRHAEIPVCLSIRFPVSEVAMTLTTDYRDPPFHRLYMGEAKDPMLDGSGQHEPRPRMHQVGTEWIALDSHEASIVSLMALPVGLDGYARTQPCLCRGKPRPGKSRTAPGDRTEAGFLITTNTECPRGEHILYGSYLISAQPYLPGDEEAALNLQHNRLTTQVSVLQPANRP